MANKWLVSRTGIGFSPGTTRYRVTHGLEIRPITVVGTAELDTVAPTATLDTVANGSATLTTIAVTAALDEQP